MTRLRALGVLAVCAALATVAIGTLAARSLGEATYLHVGQRSIGEIDPQPGGGWVISCEAYDGAYIMPGRNSRIDVYDAHGSHWGYARRERAGRWAINVVFPKQRNPAGTAIRRTSKRWDVRRRRDGNVGHTEGPAGPAAAAALLIVCTG